MRSLNPSVSVPLVAVMGALSATWLAGCSPSAPPPPPVDSTSIGCLGRIEPGDGVVRVGARSLSGQPSIVAKLLVREREDVKAGQVLAELDSTEQLRATYLLGEARVEVARKRLAQVQAGAKASDVAAQRAEIERVKAELENARRELKRYEALGTGNAVAESRVDEARLRVESLTRRLQQANDQLASLSEVRPVDVEVARAEVDAGIREVARAEAEYKASVIRSPIDGRVLEVHAWPGEQVGSEGLMELAQIDPMYVLAEVAENDMARVHTGQRARITGKGLPADLTGTVESVGLKVSQNSVMQLDPAQFTDARIVEVKIRLEDGGRVANLVHFRVKVVIDAGASPSDRPAAR
jgi:HlyD family secretion protein